ncbi:MAG: signal peptidase II [Anaerolineae bacterium]|nr:signal peptidase II [Anaerolineae bacterium]
MTHEGCPATAATPRRAMGRWLLLLSVATLAILADQASKAYVVRHLGLYESWAPVSALERVFRFTHVHNTGAAFGLFPQGGVVFLVIAVIVSAIILYYYRQVSSNGWLIRLALGLQLGGALGNVIDRVRLGYVVDFLDVWRWPVFNVADSCVVIGVGLLVLLMLREERRERQRLAAREETGEDNALEHCGEQAS